MKRQYLAAVLCVVFSISFIHTIAFGVSDDFANPPLDPSKWSTLEAVREIKDGKLRLNTQGGG